jgi:glucokinase
MTIYGADGEPGAAPHCDRGVFLGGGIVLRSRLALPVSMHAFTAKGRMRTLMKSMPVHIISNEKTALLAAARSQLSQWRQTRTCVALSGQRMITPGYRVGA